MGVNEEEKKKTHYQQFYYSSEVQDDKGGRSRYHPSWSSPGFVYYAAVLP